MSKRHYFVKGAAVFLVVLMLLPSVSVLSGGATPSGENFVLGSLEPYQKSYDSSVIDRSNFIGYTNQSEKIGIVLGFSWRNGDQLQNFLTGVNDPKSQNYRHFMTWDELKDNHAPREDMYNATVDWLRSSGIHIEHTWALRNSISIVDSVGNIERVFHTRFADFRGDGIGTRDVYYAAIEPLQVPENIIPYMDGISGTNNALLPHMHYYTKSGTDYCTGADTAKMDRVFELYNDTSDGSASNKHIFATGLTVATVLWEGSAGLFGGEAAPYDPSAVNYYFQHGIPTWIQDEGVMSRTWGYGVESDCVAPSSDTDGSVSIENELDLEMVGTMAPGVTTVCVYSDSGQKNFPSDNYNYILNTLTHNSTLVAVSNSWGYQNGEGSIDATTMADVEALNALGVTVLASSGDSGKDSPSAPSTATYDNYGFMAIGGTEPHPNGVDDSNTDDTAVMAYNTNTENPRSSEPSWSGSQSGVSGNYPEPWWQNVTIGSGQGGRVTADISSMGTNTMIYISDGSGNNAWNTQYSGTSFSCPLIAGMFAEMAAYAGRYYDGEGSSTSDSTIYGFGFFVPTIYLLAYDYYHNGMYTSTPPFFDVTQGGNSDVNAATGYDHPTGWGVPNAYELIHDIGFMMSSNQSSRTIYAGDSTYYNINLWFPYQWTSEVGHFQVAGLPDQTSFSTDVGYVHPAGNSAQSYVNVTISTSAYTPAGNYTLTISACTYNHTSGHWGNLTNSLQVTLNVLAATFDITVHTGWNLISYPVLASGEIEDVLNDSNVVWDYAQWYNPTDTGDHWKTHVIGRSLNDLNTIDNTMAVWLHVTDAGDGYITVRGPSPTSTSIVLHPGWNLVSYPASSSSVMNSANLPVEVTKIAEYDGSAVYQLSEVSDWGANSFEPGNGYWLYSTAETTWNVVY